MASVDEDEDQYNEAEPINKSVKIYIMNERSKQRKEDALEVEKVRKKQERIERRMRNKLEALEIKSNIEKLTKELEKKQQDKERIYEHLKKILREGKDQLTAEEAIELSKLGLEVPPNTTINVPQPTTVVTTSTSNITVSRNSNITVGSPFKMTSTMNTINPPQMPAAVPKRTRSPSPIYSRPSYKQQPPPPHMSFQKLEEHPHRNLDYNSRSYHQYTNRPSNVPPSAPYGSFYTSPVTQGIPFTHPSSVNSHPAGGASSGVVYSYSSSNRDRDNEALRKSSPHSPPPPTSSHNTPPNHTTIYSHRSAGMPPGPQQPSHLYHGKGSQSYPDDKYYMVRPNSGPQVHGGVIPVKSYARCTGKHIHFVIEQVPVIKLSQQIEDESDIDVNSVISTPISVCPNQNIFLESTDEVTDLDYSTENRIVIVKPQNKVDNTFEENCVIDGSKSDVDEDNIDGDDLSSDCSVAEECNNNGISKNELSNVESDDVSQNDSPNAEKESVINVTENVISNTYTDHEGGICVVDDKQNNCESNIHASLFHDHEIETEDAANNVDIDTDHSHVTHDLESDVFSSEQIETFIEEYEIESSVSSESNLGINEADNMVDEIDYNQNYMKSKCNVETNYGENNDSIIITNQNNDDTLKECNQNNEDGHEETVSNNSQTDNRDSHLQNKINDECTDDVVILKNKLNVDRQSKCNNTDSSDETNIAKISVLVKEDGELDNVTDKENVTNNPERSNHSLVLSDLGQRHHKLCRRHRKLKRIKYSTNQESKNDNNDNELSNFTRTSSSSTESQSSDSSFREHSPLNNQKRKHSKDVEGNRNYSIRDNHRQRCHKKLDDSGPSYNLSNSQKGYCASCNLLEKELQKRKTQITAMNKSLARRNSEIGDLKIKSLRMKGHVADLNKKVDKLKCLLAEKQSDIDYWSEKYTLWEEKYRQLKINTGAIAASTYDYHLENPHFMSAVVNHSQSQRTSWHREEWNSLSSTAMTSVSWRALNNTTHVPSSLKSAQAINPFTPQQNYETISSVPLTDPTLNFGKTAATNWPEAISCESSASVASDKVEKWTRLQPIVKKRHRLVTVGGCAENEDDPMDGHGGQHPDERNINNYFVGKRFAQSLLVKSDSVEITFVFDPTAKVNVCSHNTYRLLSNRARIFNSFKLDKHKYCISYWFGREDTLLLLKRRFVLEYWGPKKSKDTNVNLKHGGSITAGYPVRPMATTLHLTSSHGTGSGGSHHSSPQQQQQGGPQQSSHHSQHPSLSSHHSQQQQPMPPHSSHSSSHHGLPPTSVSHYTTHHLSQQPTQSHSSQQQPSSVSGGSGPQHHPSIAHHIQLGVSHHSQPPPSNSHHQNLAHISMHHPSSQGHHPSQQHHSSQASLHHQQQQHHSTSMSSHIQHISSHKSQQEARSTNVVTSQAYVNQMNAISGNSRVNYGNQPPNHPH